MRRGGTPVAARPARGTGGGPDLVERGFEAESPNRPHVADVAYVRMANGSFGHTAFAADVFARMIAGRACATSMGTGGRRRGRWSRRYHGPPRMAAQALPGFEGPGAGDVPAGLVAGTRSVRTGPWATGHRNGPKPGIIQTRRRKPPRYRDGTKIRPYQYIMQRI